jgi:hypothetical protein
MPQIKKTGYAKGSGQDQVVLGEGLKKVSFENDPFGIPAATAFASLRNRLAARGWIAGDRLIDAEVRVWSAPSGISEGELATLKEFVIQGGKLVALADWAGARNYSPEAYNRLLSTLGMVVETNLLRLEDSNPREWLIPILGDTLISDGISRIKLLGASTIRSAPPFNVLASAPTGAYSLQSLSAPMVAAVRQVGSGLVIAVSDTSAFMDPDVNLENNLDYLVNLVLF